MPQSFWIISTNTKEEKKARKLLEQVLNKIEIDEVEVDFKAHHETKLIYGEYRLNHDYPSKAEVLFEVIKYAQSIGYYWQLFGMVETQLDGRSDDSNISGIILMEWQIEYE